jgi:dUTPase
LGVKGIVPFRGIIDAGYTGQVMVVLRNGTDKPHRVEKYDRVAQICLHQMEHADIVVVDEFSYEYNQRGTAGFGSSGN